MTDRPILFSAPMVLALLDGRKTQTRRVLKPQPEQGFEPWQADGGDWFLAGMASQTPLAIRFCKGDRLWARENLWLYGRWRQEGTTPKGRPRQTFDLIGKVATFEKPADIAYWGGKAGFSFRPGIHMPRWASRLTLTVTDVRVQRLQEISPADAIAEGIWAPATSFTIDCETRDPRDDFQALWNTINGAGSWDANPWVVAVTFTVETLNIDARAPHA